MYLAFDDTDSKDSMCTTYLMARFLSETKYSVIGLPRLVRLNPNIRFKTRGNGALCVKLGARGHGVRSRLGTYGGKHIFSYEYSEEIDDPKEVLDLAVDLVDRLAVMSDPNTNPGIVISNSQLPPEIYYNALRMELSIEEIEKILSRHGALWVKRKNGRGIIGAAAAISWPMASVTYECIAYESSGQSGIAHVKKLEIASFAESYPGSFNNVDVDNGYAAIFPKERTPVVYGIRAVNGDELLEFSDSLDSRFGLTPKGKIVYVTNQATDDHIVSDPETLEELGSYSIEGTVTENPYSIEGGHYFVTMAYGNMEVKIAAFEPTKSFRQGFSELRVGDQIRVFGSFVNHALHVEKMQIISTSRAFIRDLPTCEKCHIQTKSKGSWDFRCPSCGSKYRHANYVESVRDIAPGYYDVPVMARRHLSRPFDIAAAGEVKAQ